MIKPAQTRGARSSNKKWSGPILTRIDASGPWRRAAHITAKGEVVYRDLTRPLKSLGFQRVRTVVWPGLAETFKSLAAWQKNNFEEKRRYKYPLHAKCIQFRLEVCGLLRLDRYYHVSGSGWGWTISWNHARLERAVLALEDASPNTAAPDYGMQLYENGPVARKWTAVRDHYSPLAAWLRHTTESSAFTEEGDVFPRVFVAIPGIENITDKALRAFLHRLQRVLADTWTIAQATARSGPEKGARALTSSELSLIRRRVRHLHSAKAIADEIEQKRSGTNAEPNGALYKSVQRSARAIRSLSHR